MDSSRQDDPEAAKLERCRSGDAGAWRELVQQHGPLVSAVARRYGLEGADHDDLVQDMFLTLLQHLDDIRDPKRLGSWLVTTTSREAIRRVRALREQRKLSSAPLEDIAHAEDDEELALIEERHRVHLALRRIDERCRKLLDRLYGPEPASYDDVAREFGMPLGSIGPTRARCIEKLKKLVE